MGLYKLIFAKGYHFSLRWGLANGPGNAANHMHALMTLLIGSNVLTIISYILFLFFGKKVTIDFLVNGIWWAIDLGLVYWLAYIYFIWKKEYISISESFYKTSKYRGRSGTVIAISFIIGSNLLLALLVFIISKDKFK